MKYFALLIAVSVATGLSGCDSGRNAAPFGAVTQRAAESGNVVVSNGDKLRTIKEIQDFAKTFGLVEWRDSDLERALGESEHRPIYSAYFLRRNKIAFYFSNDIGATNFSYQLFREPFSKEDFPKFSGGVFKILGIHGGQTYKSGAVEVPPNNSFKPKPLRGSA